MVPSDRSTLAVVVAVVLGAFAIVPLTQDLSFLGASWLLILLLAALTVALRRSRLPAVAVLGAQLVTWLVYLGLLSATLTEAGGTGPAHVVALWSRGVRHMQNQASPMAPDDGVKLIFVVAIGLVWILTELVVAGLRRPAWAVVPIGVLFAVPAVGLGTDTGALSFLGLALGYLAILVAEGLNRTAHWTRGLSSDSAVDHGTATPVVWRAAGLIGVPAVVLTLVLGVALPTFTLSGLGIGSGPGGNGPLQLADPTLDLKRNLTQPQDKPVIEYRSDRPGGLYLRMASLPQFSSAGWTNVPMQLDPGKQLPQIPGLSSEPSQQRRTTIDVLDFKSEYLPLPFAPRSIDAQGSWAYDPQSLVMLSMARGDRAAAIRNLHYTVTSVDIAPDVKDLNSALPGTPADSAITAAVPRDLPQSLIRLTEDVTAGQHSAAGKAAAIQAFLRSDQFTYSTEALPGSGYRALENFLLKDRKGYCEQFATSMAMMARIVGIPSRVGVGFLPGERKGDHYEISIRDMHAWPELYFSGFGWVRFEPTPATLTGSAPSWTVPDDSDPADDPSASASASAAAPSSAPSQRPSLDPDEQTTGVDAAAGFPWGRTLAGSGAGLLALLVLAAPATIRRRRRADRLSPDLPVEERVEAAWREIHDSVLDYGGSWPDGSPRVIGGEIGSRFEGGGTDTMTEVATLVERSRYSRSFTDVDAARSLPAMTEDIRRSLALPQTRRRRLAAVVLPRSLFRRRRRD